MFRPRVVLVLTCLSIACGTAPSAAIAADAIDRLTPQRLEAVHQSIEKLKTQRKPLARRGPFTEHRANLHVHSAFSHDSRGKIEDIVASAKAAGSDILMFTEHPAAHYDVFSDGHQGTRDGVLLIQGAETNGMLVYPRQSIREFLKSQPQELSDFVRGRDGLTFVSHLEERMDWQLAGITGVEIYNTHADVKDEKRLLSSMKNPLWLIKTADLYRKYPQEALSSLLDYPADYLHRWDELCQITPHTGVSANDAHQNIGVTVRLAEDNKVKVEDGLEEQLLLLDKNVFATIQPIPDDAKVGTVLFQLRLDPYVNSLRHVGTHLLLRELSQPAVFEALNQGRAFVAFDWLADSKGFDFAAETADARHEMGSQLKLSDGLKLTGQSPVPATWKLICNGEPVRETTGTTLEVPVKAAGNYRVELWLDISDENKIWILSNPIYIENP